LGRQVAVPDLQGAINYWCEAVQIAATLHKAAPDRIMDLRYEDLVADVPGAMGGVLDYADLRARPGSIASRRPSRTEPLARGAGNRRNDRGRRCTMRRAGPVHGYDLEACVATPGVAP
jgi:hypothetical protein